VADKGKVSYDEAAVDKMIDEAQGVSTSGSGSIEVMLA